MHLFALQCNKGNQCITTFIQFMAQAFCLKQLHI